MFSLRSRYVARCSPMFAVARTVMVVHMVCGAVLGGTAFKDLQIALRWWCQGGLGSRFAALC